MTDTRNFWRDSANGRYVWIDTSMHRAVEVEMDDDTAYPVEDLRQGRDCQTPVPTFSMYAGKPEPQMGKTGLMFWAFYAAVVGFAVLAFLLRVWPR